MLPPDFLTDTTLLHAAMGALAGVLVGGGFYLWRDREYLSWRWHNRNEPLPAEYVPDDSTYQSYPPPDEEERRRLPLTLLKDGAIFAALAVAFLDGADWLFPAMAALLGVAAAAKILFGDGAGVMEVGADAAGFTPRQTLRQRIRLAATELSAVFAVTFGWITSLRGRDESGWMAFVDSDWFLVAVGLIMMAASVFMLVNVAASEDPEVEGKWSAFDDHPKLGEGVAAAMLFLAGLVIALTAAF